MNRRTLGSGERREEGGVRKGDGEEDARGQPTSHTTSHRVRREEKHTEIRKVKSSEAK